MMTSENDTAGSGRVDSTQEEEVVKQLQATVLRMKKEMEAKDEVFEKCKSRINSLEFTIEKKDIDLCARNNRLEELQRLNRSMLLLLNNGPVDKLSELKDLQRKCGELNGKYGLLSKSREEWGCRINVIDKKIDELQRREKEIERKEKDGRFESEMKTEHLEPTFAAKDAYVDLFTSDDDQSWIEMDGRSLQLAVNKHFERIEFTNTRISAALEASPDPAKLVLDAMKGIYIGPSNVSVDKEELQFDFRVVRKSCILLLKKLKGMSPTINPQVTEEAMKLAVDWKAQMTVGAVDSWEALGFLRLITTYEIAGMFDPRERQELVNIVADPALAIEINRVLGITDETPVESQEERKRKMSSISSSAPQLPPAKATKI